MAVQLATAEMGVKKSPAIGPTAAPLMPTVNALFELAREHEGNRHSKQDVTSTAKKPDVGIVVRSDGDGRGRKAIESDLVNYAEDAPDGAQSGSRRRRRGGRHRNRERDGSRGDGEDGCEIPNCDAGDKADEPLMAQGLEGVLRQLCARTRRSRLPAEHQPSKCHLSLLSSGHSDGSTAVGSSTDEECQAKQRAADLQTKFKLKHSDQEWKTKFSSSLEIVAACPGSEDQETRNRWRSHLESSDDPEHEARRILRMTTVLCCQGFFSQPDVLEEPPGVTDAKVVNTFSVSEFASVLEACDPQVQKQMMGEKMYDLISQSEPALAGKITGMMLATVTILDLIELLKSDTLLQVKIDEAVNALRAPSEVPRSRCPSSSSSQDKPNEVRSSTESGDAESTRQQRSASDVQEKKKKGSNKIRSPTL